LAPPGATLILVRGSGLFNHIPICFADAPVAFNQDVKAICPREGTDPLFLHFWIESLRPILKESIGVTGIGAGKFDLSFLQGLPFPDLPIERQEAIGKLAASFDRKIELNRRMNATLETMARAIFRDWFVDFGPTRAKMEGRAPYLAPDLWPLFPDRLDDEGKPEGWEMSEIGKEATAVGGSTPSTKEPAYWGGNINWATPKDLSSLKAPVLLETSRTITEAGLEKISSGL
jgi:Restriction endonuclease S subunits